MSQFNPSMAAKKHVQYNISSPQDVGEHLRKTKQNLLRTHPRNQHNHHFAQQFQSGRIQAVQANQQLNQFRVLSEENMQLTHSTSTQLRMTEGDNFGCHFCR